MAKQVKKSNIYFWIALFIAIAFCGFFVLQGGNNTVAAKEYKHSTSTHPQVKKSQNDRIDANVARPVVDATKPRYPIRFIDNAIIKDSKTGRSFKGTIDLKPTLDRIRKGGKYPHRNDGSVFKNRPKQDTRQIGLPKKALGYYREYVHPTPNFSGPGPQRIIVGQGGDIYYTSDHYETFIRIK
jgi:guanyl-specific ribonuclease Sa